MNKEGIDLLRAFIRRTDPEWDINQDAVAYLERLEKADADRKASYDGHEAYEEDMK